MSEIKLDSSGLTTPSVKIGDNILSSSGNTILLNGEEFKSGGSHNVGEQWISMDGTVPFGGLAFLGQTVSKETYIELYNWVETNGRFKTEAEWQTLYTANNGNVSFYAKIDDNTFRLPSFKGYLKANENAGEYTKEGLPNITGLVTYITADASNIQSTEYPTTGAFRWTNEQYNSSAVTTSERSGSRDLSFNASRSSSIYGNSSHVTPETNTILIGVYAFNQTINDSDIEIDTIRQRVDELETLSKHAVGEQWISMDGTVPPGGVPFNGQLLNISDYQNLYNWAKINGRIKSESEWQTLNSNNNSNVAYYSDYSETHFRMPLFRGYLKASSNGGSYTKEGLPNIWGQAPLYFWSSKDSGSTGALTYNTGTNHALNGGTTADFRHGHITLDASHSSQIYGNSSHVTPETNSILVGVYAFNTVINSSIIDVSSLNDKINELQKEAVVGEIKWYSGSTVPPGYLTCNGAKVSRTTYSNLFAAIGTKWGTGDGSTTFTLPNLIGRVAWGATNGGGYLEAGLPNITGHISQAYYGYGTWGVSGAFTNAYFEGSATRGGGGGNPQNISFDFNAAASNAIYGKSSTVQPPAATLIPIIKY